MDGLREHGVGVGDVDEVPDRAGSRGDPAGGVDGRGSMGLSERSGIGGDGERECVGTGECAGDGIGELDGAGGRLRPYGVHGRDDGGSDGVRGHGVGVGDVGPVSGRIGDRQLSKSVGDGGRRIRVGERGDERGRRITVECP